MKNKNNDARKHRHVLLLEDMKLNRDLTIMLLEREGYEVTAVAGALDALQAMTRFNFDVALLDVQMHGMDGITAVKVIRSCERGDLPVAELGGDLAERLVNRLHGRVTPIIIMTASTYTEDKREGLAAGADDFLAKPFTPQEILSTLERVVAEA